MIVVEDGASEAGHRSIASQFFRFCIVGAAGFTVDAGVLMILLSRSMLGPFGARLVSFALAVMTTFLLNRGWSFKGGAALSFWPTFLSYLGVQGTGFACNFAIYSLLYLILPSPIGSPLYCLGLASAGSMLVNFLGARTIVFRANRRFRRA